MIHYEVILPSCPILVYLDSKPLGKLIYGLNGINYMVVYGLSAVVSFKVRKEIKEKMETYRDRVNWAEELRRFVEEKIAMLEAEENIKKIVEELKKVRWNVPKGFSTTSVREDRDSS